MIIFDQSAADYHASEHIGASTAKLALDSLQLFDDYRNGLVPNASSRALNFGTAFHAAILEPHLYANLISAGPINDKTGKPYGRDSKVFSEWEASNPGKLVLDGAELDTITTMIARMPGEVRGVFAHRQSAKTEVSVYRDIDGLPVKCRTDHLDEPVITDLKTIDDIDGIAWAFKSYKYWFSQEWYKRVLLAETGVRHRFQFVFAEKKPPYRWRIVQTNDEVCEEGAMLVRGVMSMLRDAQKSGTWTDAASIHEEITWPDCGHYEEIA